MSQKRVKIHKKSFFKISFFEFPRMQAMIFGFFLQKKIGFWGTKNIL